MGFCLLNNVALAAEHLLQNENARRLAIVDMDVHHGNGTQDIFYARGDVLFVSSHQHPFYPGTGMLDERGTGAGEGATMNMPLPAGSGDRAFAACYGELVPAVLDRFQPEMVLVSAGFDAHWRDPLGNLRVSAQGYGEAVSSLRGWAERNCGGRIAAILEGGYDLDADAACGLAITQALLGEGVTDDLGPSPTPEGTQWMQVIEDVRRINGLAK
jgi:acetoin utilization deacetylase AcuC-like enzyme